MAYEFLYPDDLIAHLNKGDTIRLSRIMPLIRNYNETDRPLLIMQWGFGLEKAMAVVGKPCTVRTRNRHTMVCILTDEEAAQYNASKFHAKARGMRRANHKLLEVDTSNLEYDQKSQYDRDVIINGYVLSEMDRAYRKIKRNLVVEAFVSNDPPRFKE